MAATSRRRVMLGFDYFIGIDWSGAKGRAKGRVKALKAAICGPGKSSPKLMQPQKGKNWCRDELIDAIIQEASHKRLLVGADFAFAFPYCDRGAYFPGFQGGPESVSALWNVIETICKDKDNYYGGPFYQDQTTPFSQYLLYQTYKGSHFDITRLRKTEQTCLNMGARPTCSFKCVGPDQVGPGSVAGMRALNYIARNHSKTISIWPFDSLMEGKSALVEIFPRLFFILAGKKPKLWGNIDNVNAVLEHFGSKPLPQSTEGSEDEIDAIVSAAALRNMCSNWKVWNLRNLDSQVKTYEGWIFGAL